MIDGLPENIQRSFYPTIQHDLTLGLVRTKVDLAHCQEVVEHIDERYLGNLLDSLATGRVILMSHALPGQSGCHHVNLQSSDYWIEHVSSQGYSFLGEDTKRIREKAVADGAPYMSETGLLFHQVS